jgi:hypothetical protein
MNTIDILLDSENLSISIANRLSSYKPKVNQSTNIKQPELFPLLGDKEFIKYCVRKASKGKRKRRDWKRWLKNQDRNIDTLIDDLVNMKYYIKSYKEVDVMLEKPRTLAILKVRDRIVQTIITELIKENYFDKYFVKNTYACVEGRGNSKLNKDLSKFLHNNVKKSKYYLQLDIKKYFPNINPHILIDVLSKIVKDPYILEYCKRIIYSYVDGQPVGNTTSQHFANAFITELEHILMEKFKVDFLCVYMDDILILGSNYEKLRRIGKYIKKWLKKERNLELKFEPEVKKVDDNGIPYVGFVYHHHYTKLKNVNVHKLLNACNEYIQGKMTKYDFKGILISYRGMMMHANCKGLSTFIYNYLKFFRPDEEWYISTWRGKTLKYYQFEGKSIRMIAVWHDQKNIVYDFIMNGKPYRFKSRSWRIFSKIKGQVFWDRKRCVMKHFDYTFPVLNKIA